MTRALLAAALTSTMLAVIALSARLSAEVQHNGHHHYKLVDMGTLGGPSSYFNSGGRDLNNRGVASFSAETAIADPFAPLCFLPECFVPYGVQWHDRDQTSLGVLPEGNIAGPQDPCFDCAWTSFPTWINDDDVVVGFSENNTMDSAAGVPTVLGVLWQGGRITNVGTLGGAQSGALAVNRNGDVIGTALNNVPDPFPNRFPYIYFANTTETHAFVWRRGVMQDLGTLGGADSLAFVVNDSGQITGQSDVDFNFNPVTGNPTVHPFLWDRGKMQDLGTLGGTFAYPSSLNSRGDVVGGADLVGDNTTHPFLWTKEGGIQDLGTLGGSFGHADFISDRREVVGTAFPPGDTGLRAFLWKDGVTTNLGTLGDDPDSEAIGINSRGQIIGGTYILGVEDLRGFLWEDGGPMVDLNALVINGDGIQILGPASINERGEMVAPGILANGDVHAFMLTPCDKNHPSLEGCDYSLVGGTAPVASAVTPVRSFSLPRLKNRLPFGLRGLR